MRQAKGLAFVDLDSTLANSLHRHHLIDPDWDKTDWVAYAAASADDEIFEGVAVLVRELFVRHAIVVVSGRNDTAVDISRAWLQIHHVPFDEMLLRPHGDDRPNEQFKIETMQAYVAEHGRDPDLVVDDWPPLAPLLEKLGWPLLLVNPNYPIPEDVQRAIDETWESIENGHAWECPALVEEVLTLPELCNCPVSLKAARFRKISGYLRRYEPKGAS